MAKVIIKVAKGSKVNKVAGMTAAMVRGEKEVELHAVGSKAVNQAAKAIALARKYLEQDALDISVFMRAERTDPEKDAVIIVMEIVVQDRIPEEFK